MYKNLTEPVAKEKIVKNIMAWEQKDCVLGIAQQMKIAG